VGVEGIECGPHHTALTRAARPKLVKKDTRAKCKFIYYTFCLPTYLYAKVKITGQNVYVFFAFRKDSDRVGSLPSQKVVLLEQCVCSVHRAMHFIGR